MVWENYGEDFVKKIVKREEAKTQPAALITEVFKVRRLMEIWDEELWANPHFGIIREKTVEACTLHELLWPIEQEFGELMMSQGHQMSATDHINWFTEALSDIIPDDWTMVGRFGDGTINVREFITTWLWRVERVLGKMQLWRVLPLNRGSGDYDWDNWRLLYLCSLRDALPTICAKYKDITTGDASCEIEQWIIEHCGCLQPHKMFQRIANRPDEYGEDWAQTARVYLEAWANWDFRA
jgi:hypothetical protein